MPHGCDPLTAYAASDNLACEVCASTRARYMRSPDRGPGGGFALSAHYTLPPVNFTAEEAASLFLSIELLLEMRIMPLV